MTINVGQSLDRLGIKEWKLDKEPSNEEEFIKWFHKIVGIDNNNHSILSNDPRDFGVTWKDIISTKEILEKEYSQYEYRNQRKYEYPSLVDFADAYYWAQKGDNTKMNEYIVNCDIVKEKYPKVTDAN